MHSKEEKNLLRKQASLANTAKRRLIAVTHSGYSSFIREEIFFLDMRQFSFYYFLFVFRSRDNLS